MNRTEAVDFIVMLIFAHYSSIKNTSDTKQIWDDEKQGFVSTDTYDNMLTKIEKEIELFERTSQHVK
tara:strand:- start:421 stop:621 length:201 start_codon:yes stop_codon:yes gene_type:complete